MHSNYWQGWRGRPLPLRARTRRGCARRSGVDLAFQSSRRQQRRTWSAVKRSGDQLIAESGKGREPQGQPANTSRTRRRHSGLSGRARPAEALSSTHRRAAGGPDGLSSRRVLASQYRGRLGRYGVPSQHRTTCSPAPDPTPAAPRLARLATPQVRLVLRAALPRPRRGSLRPRARLLLVRSKLGRPLGVLPAPVLGTELAARLPERLLRASLRPCSGGRGGGICSACAGGGSGRDPAPARILRAAAGCGCVGGRAALACHQWQIWGPFSAAWQHSHRLARSS
jgi:hypothetical protein